MGSETPIAPELLTEDPCSNDNVILPCARLRSPTMALSWARHLTGEEAKW